MYCARYNVLFRVLGSVLGSSTSFARGAKCTLEEKAALLSGLSQCGWRCWRGAADMKQVSDKCDWIR